MARMVRMMDSMVVQENAHQMMMGPVRKTSVGCPVHSSGSSQSKFKSSSSAQSKAVQVRPKVDKPVSWTIKPNGEQSTVPKERTQSMCEGSWKNSLRQREKL